MYGGKAIAKVSKIIVNKYIFSYNVIVINLAGDSMVKEVKLYKIGDKINIHINSFCELV